MPEMDGPTMFGELRKRGVSAKVIFVSGYAEDAFAKNLPRARISAFCRSPSRLKQLIETVKDADGAAAVRFPGVSRRCTAHRGRAPKDEPRLHQSRLSARARVALIMNRDS